MKSKTFVCNRSRRKEEVKEELRIIGERSEQKKRGQEGREEGGREGRMDGSKYLALWRYLTKRRETSIKVRCILTICVG